VYESDEDVEKLQALLDRSDERAGAHLRSIFRPERWLTARQVVAFFDGTRQVEFVARYGGSPSTVENNVVYVRVTAESMFAFAQRPAEVPA
jgi:hypothetical protein